MKITLNLDTKEINTWSNMAYISKCYAQEEWQRETRPQMRKRQLQILKTKCDTYRQLNKYATNIIKHKIKLTNKNYKLVIDKKKGDE